MESANKAIMMAFGMIIGVMIMAAIAFVFNNLKVLPQGDDSKETVEQLTAFNREYEVYDKKIMYGVDVISVLNKAISNNEKYVLGNFLSGAGYNTDYIIDIEVILHDTLTEKLTVTYLENTASGVREVEYTNGYGTNINASTVFDIPSEKYRNTIYTSSSLWNSLKLKTNTDGIVTTVKGDADGERYHLLGPDILKNPSYTPGEYTNTMIEEDSVLKILLQQSADMIKTVKNHGTNKYIERNADNTINESATGWNRATWYPAIYDFKQRKFKCLGDQVVYSEKTGRIIKMTFEEV